VTVGLNYRKEPRGRVGRRVALLTIVLALAVAASVGIRERAAIEFALERAYYARQCAKFAAPANVVLNEPDAVKAAGMAGAGRNYVLNTSWPGKMLAVHRPWCVQRLDRMMGSAGLVGPVMNQGMVECPTVFLHERASPGGHRRLVHVELVLRNAMLLEECFAATVMEESSLMKDGKVVVSQRGAIYGGPYVAAKISYGRIDQEDASHFLFDYVLVNPQDENAVKYELAPRGTIDAYLGDDDRVRFSARKQ
jgi:hypothetical protein